MRRPLPFLVLVAVITAGLGYASTGITTHFSIRDLLPPNGSLSQDLDALDTAVGGSTEVVSVVVWAEVTETRTLLNLLDFTAAFDDELRRPRGAAAGIHTSHGLLVGDWITDSGTPGDKYDPELRDLFDQATAGLQVDRNLVEEFLDKLQEMDPDAVARVLHNNPDGPDTTLLQFQSYAGDPQRTKRMREDIEGLWFGDDAEISASSPEIVTITIADEIRESQTYTTVATILAALSILAFFFWVTARQPVLGIIAIAPVVIAIIWVLGTMALLGIPYTIATSVVTALSVGIGVDYTIHIIHRYQEEFSRLRIPEMAAARTLATTGSALLGSALTTGLGVAVLIFSPLQSFQHFGIMVALTIAYSLVVSILLVPLAITAWGKYRNMRLRAMVAQLWDDLDEVVEDTYRRHGELQDPD